MNEEKTKYFSWDFYSRLIILGFCTLQIIRWPIFPQFMDTYYHLHTAWGFLKAGGYSVWDFWQYAPAGRPHIYPPLFHVILAFLMKSGINTIILAKLLEAVSPIAFLIVLWSFIRKYFGSILAFFVALVFGSFFSFYLSLIDHLPSTLALIFGFLGLGKLFQKKYFSAIVLFSLGFYTHIGVSWLFVLSIIFYGIFDAKFRKSCFLVIVITIILSSPILFRQIINLKHISNLGFNMPEANVIRIKIVDYIFAFLGIALVFKKEAKYRFFLSLFLASLIFALYPRRLFTQEGYLPIMLLCALFLSFANERFRPKIKRTAYFIIPLAIVVLIFSPTLVLNTGVKEIKERWKLEFFRSAFTGMLFARGESIWFPKEYLSAAKIITDNSAEQEIIFSSLNNIGIALAAISGRPSANALLPEVGSSYKIEPLSTSKIIIFMRDDEQNLVDLAIARYNLVKIGENKMFLFYKNPLCNKTADFKPAIMPFWAILLILLVVLVALFGSRFYIKYI